MFERDSKNLPVKPTHDSLYHDLSSTVEIGYNIMKGTEYFVVIINCCYNRGVYSDEWIGSTEYLTL
jgi:hypothetical protein